MSNMLILIYVFIIMYNPISVFLPYGNYADEVLCLILLVCGLIKFIRGKLVLYINDNTKVFVACGIIFLLGIFSNMIFGYATSMSGILRDMLSTFKFFIVYYSGKYLLNNYENHKLKKRMIFVSKCCIVVIFVFAIVSLFVDVGMGSDIRYGITSFKFIYTHYTYLVINEVMLLSTVMCDEKKNYEYYAMSFATLFLTLRTKAFMFIFIVVAVSIVFFLRKNKENIDLKSLLKKRYIVPGSIGIYLVANSKIQEYFSWGISSSIRLGMHLVGIEIMKDHFPLGTGFATYGTNLSYKESSILYSIYNSLNYQNLLYYGSATMSDIYWPSIYAQFGFVGLVAFCVALFFCIKNMIENTAEVPTVKKAIVCVMVYMIFASTAEAVFSNESGVFVPLFVVMLNCFSNKVVCETK